MALKWEDANITWDSARFTWEEASLVAEIAGRSSDYGLIFKDKEKKKKFIKILCKIEGVEYKETKEVKERRIRITDVELAIREVLGIDVKVNL
tara:strand:+ start:320 stop:598 length:279 start_codon:yes stop_codon:yes gene_type:complete